MSFIPQESHLKYSIVDAGLQTFDRVKAFKDLRSGLKLYKPDAKLIYGWVGDYASPSDLLKITSTKRDPVEELLIRTDYALVYSYEREYPNGFRELMYWVELPMRFSPKSLNVFMYYQKRGMLKEYFEDYIKSTMKIKPNIFNSYLEQVAGLSTRPKMKDKKSNELIANPNYWKLENNTIRVLKAISEMGVMYREKQ